MSPAPDALSNDACWRALRARDARFDGCFFTGVTSTGIYCRPVCRVRTPRRENCRFFTLAAQAERAGFRPCLRCRPELAPATPASPAWSLQEAGAILARQAAQLIDALPGAAEPAEPTGGSALAGVAARLGVSDRHLRRLFEAQFGVSPLQYLQTRRLLTAKQLLADTRLPVSEVAQLSGFASLRRFNAAFAQHYGLAPTRLRREGAPAGGSALLRLGWRPPLDADALLGFFAARHLPGVEAVDGAGLARTLAVVAGGRVHTGWLQARFDAPRHQLLLRVSDSLQPALPAVIRRVRAAFDLDADPEAIDAVLHAAFPGSAGLRVPGAFDGFELAVRAVLGQQITVAAARTLARRLVQALGEPLTTPLPGLDRLFPTAQALAAADPEALGRLGIVRQRQAALQALGREVAAGRLALQPGADLQGTLAQLRALPGIGEWTAQYIAMRALRWPDAFPSGDVALQTALGLRGQRQPARAAEALAAAWAPWRSYAVVRAWATLEAKTTPEAPSAPEAAARGGSPCGLSRPAQAGREPQPSAPQGGATSGPAKPVPRWPPYSVTAFMQGG